MKKHLKMERRIVGKKQENDCRYTDRDRKRTKISKGGFSRNSIVATTRHIDELQKMETAGNTDDFTVSEWNMLFEATVADGGIQ